MSSATSAPVLVNEYPAVCSVQSCQMQVEPGGGQILFGPLRVVCAACMIATDRPHDLEARLATMCWCPVEADCAKPCGHAAHALWSGGTCGTCGKRALRPREWQLEDIRQLVSSRACLLGHAMGLGKTAMACLGCLRSDMPNMVFVPSTLKRNWEREIKLWRPDLRRRLVDTPQRWCKYFLSAKPGDVLIASYGALPGLDCPGCLQRIAEEKKARKKSRWKPGQCMHGADPHPEFKDEERTEPYHLLRPRRGETAPRVCPGCKQRFPLPSLLGPVVLLGDEVHALKTAGSRRTRLWRGLLREVWCNGGHVYGLTGTPWENRPLEGWEVLVSLGLERAAFGTCFVFSDIFSSWLNAPKGERKPLEGLKRAEFLMRMRRVRIFRRTRDHVKLPPRVQQDIHVELSPKTVLEVNETVQRMFAVRRAWHDVESGQLGDPFRRGIGEDEAKRRRLLYDERVLHYFVQKPWDFDAEIVAAVEEVMLTRGKRNEKENDRNLFAIRRLLSIAKIKAIEQWISDCEEQDEPVVLFSQHLELVKRFGDRPGWVQLHGGMNDDKKDAAVQAFQSGDAQRGIVLSGGAGREGLTLTRARVCGFADLNFNPARNRQAEARLLRIGAEHHESILIVRFLSSHPVDKLVLSLLTEKEALLDSLEPDVCC